MSNGYQQACANMAWKITELSDRDCKPILEMLGSEEEARDYVANNPQARKDWEQLDEIAEMICGTYGKSHSDLHDEVWQYLLQIMYDREGKVN